MRADSTHSLALAFAVLVSITAPQSAATAQTCGGDCSEDGVVTVDELIRGVNIALGTLAVDACPAFDGSGDGLVTVDEIVAAVVNALEGCATNATPTPTATSTVAPSTPSATPTSVFTDSPTPTPSPDVTGAVRVLISTGDFIGTPQRMVTSLSQPVLSPAGFVLVIGAVAEDPNDPVGVLMRLDAGGGRIILEEGQSIGTSGQIVASIGQPNAKLAGSFALVDTDSGAAVLRIDDDDEVEAILGIGAAGNRAELEPRRYVVAPTGDTLLADVFVPGFKRGVALVPLASDAPAISVVTTGDELSYVDAGGNAVNGTLTDTDRGESVASTPTGGSSSVVVDDVTGMFLEFAVDSQMTIERRAILVEGNQAPGLADGVRLARLDSRLLTGGGGTFDTRGFVTVLSGPGIDVTNDAAAIITDAASAPLAVVQVGAGVPGVSGAIIATVSDPIMGASGAILPIVQQGPGEFDDSALLYVDYATRTSRPIVTVGDAAPGGGTFLSLPISLALNDAGQLVFRADLGLGASGYYAVAVSDPGAPLRRLVGTGDVIALPGGGSAEITNLGSIASTAGLGGEATGVGATHFVVTATLEGIEQAVLLVEIDE